MDNRIINTHYSVPAMKLVVGLANLCLTVKEDQGPPGLPVVLKDMVTISQNWGECPAIGGQSVYYRLAEDGETVYLWDLEIITNFVGDDPTKYAEKDASSTFKLSEMDEFFTKWLNGEI